MRLGSILLLLAALLAPRAQPSVTASLQIADPGSSRLVVFSVVYTTTIAWPETTAVTVTTIAPAYLIVAKAPGCTRIALGGEQRIGCTVAAQAGQPIDSAVRFAVPWEIRGTVALSSTVAGAGGEMAPVGATFVVPPQMRLPLILQ